ncbi:LLM class flavin-dependent oxidoreductase [Mesorhizobium microcysteis]|uniref:LLM class flavin-dependent oxidoreductase n=1 Tax=Neoaquamicrobium microcysteis TaxID=2682781 RepID=A0A5D4GZ55_9HYPH|nr:LLM class flavin-dependent oxidoreductase [Mesorhizobium microcysteis]TYR33169.1 LLM class flavin-dependent oxidoreductase [Mesorhizobium microcysteis]
MSIRLTHVPADQTGFESEGDAPFFFEAERALRTLRHLEDAGFDGVLIDSAGGVLANLDLAAQAASGTSALQIAIVHSPGILAPDIAARQIAALDAASAGRIALRIAADGIGSRRSGPASHAASFGRLSEYLVLLRRLWANEAPFEHQGPFYTVRDGYVALKGPQGMAIPVRMGGLSGTAVRTAARHADVFELAPGTPEEVRLQVSRVVAAAREFGRGDKIAFALPVHLGSPSRASGVRLSGSPEEVALALLPYAALGVTELMIAGLTTAREIELFGRHTAPLLRNSIRRRLAPEPVLPSVGDASPEMAGRSRH